ncbi:MAG: PAS-domain containing protein [Alphaproteobacteria bacterium]|nr:PAS-domain containing protein [Alphaproteobacteria bacterium]
MPSQAWKPDCWDEDMETRGIHCRVPDLQAENALLRAVIDNFPGGILLYDKNLRLVVCNETQKRLLDYPPALFEFGLPTLEQIFRFNAVRGEYGSGDVEEHVHQRMRLAARREPHVFERVRPNGTVLQIRGVPLPGGGFLTTYTDITSERRQKAPDNRAVTCDMQTELPNWTLFLDRFGQVMARVRRGQIAAIHYVDIDNFKQVESRLGRNVAEVLLKSVAYRLRNVARATDTVSRLGEDEFIILQSEVDRPSSVAKLSKRVIDAIKQPFEIANYKIAVGASIGVAMLPRDGSMPEELIAKAKENLYRSRSETGENGIVKDSVNPIIAV